MIVAHTSSPSLDVRRRKLALKPGLHLPSASRAASFVVAIIDALSEIY